MNITKRMEKLDIREAVTDADGDALVNLVKSVAHKGMLIAEIGSWKGFSTAYIASIVKINHGLVFAIDHWQGNVGTWNIPIVQNQDIFSIFRQNMKYLGFEDIVIPLIMDSKNINKLFRNSIFDLVFIDADHRAIPFNTDLISLLPMVKKNGIICGHDCEVKYSTLSKEEQGFIVQYKDQDHMNGKHCGIIWTLYKIFSDKYDKVPDTRIWYYRKV